MLMPSKPLLPGWPPVLLTSSPSLAQVNVAEGHPRYNCCLMAGFGLGEGEQGVFENSLPQLGSLGTPC